MEEREIKREGGGEREAKFIIMHFVRKIKMLFYIPHNNVYQLLVTRSDVTHTYIYTKLYNLCHHTHNTKRTIKYTHTHTHTLANTCTHIKRQTDGFVLHQS